jgi:zinc and cadmium transporter
VDRAEQARSIGVLVYAGFDRRRALVLDYLTQATVVIGRVAGILVYDIVTGLSGVLLPFAAGHFVYIASSDLLPEIKREGNLLRSTLHFLVFLAGIALMLGVRLMRDFLIG